MEAHAESLDAELGPMETPAMVVESEPDALQMDTTVPVDPTPAIDVDIPVTEHIASGDISQPESALPLSEGVDNPQDNISISNMELDTGLTHIDKMPLEVVKDNDDVATDPSVIMVDPASEFPAEPATLVISSLQDKTAAETKVDSIEEVYTEVRESLLK